ncbi:SRPBCC family protein [Devosia sp.]|uniref:SRPBCC family protein n=1 Tax=Devosia sp. TaxID=1871048 RepID=UPI003BA94999
MNTATPASDSFSTRAIVVEDVLPHAPEKVWKALTHRAYLSRWLMQNDFQPVVGHKFTFKAQPMGDWDGIVHCEVLECDPPRRLVYTWVGGSLTNPTYGSALDSVLTLSLTPVNGGTLLKLVHDGFKSPQNDAGFNAMSSGWGTIIQRISALIAEMPD